MQSDNRSHIELETKFTTDNRQNKESDKKEKKKQSGNKLSGIDLRRKSITWKRLKSL